MVNVTPQGADAAAPGSDSGTLPLFVDLDGTLTVTDTLYEGLFAGLRDDPALPFRCCAWLMGGGRAGLKRKLAATRPLVIDSLPYNEEFVEFLKEESERGRPIWLATAADASIADAVSRKFGFFEGVVASDGEQNLKGGAKLAAIRSAVAGGGFVYAGNGSEDLEVWKGANGAIVVNASANVEHAAGQVTTVERVFKRAPGRARALLRALRPHQWLKNSLIGLPLLTSLELTHLEPAMATMIAMLCFSLVASGTYIFNDLLDLESDRRHPRKRRRPFASGAVPLKSGIAVGAICILAGLLGALYLPPAFWLAIVTYLVLTVGYSTIIKTYVLADVICLAGLYTIRVLAGAAAISVMPSMWLIAFSMFVFMSLALVKRCAELLSVAGRNESSTPGRDYRVGDLDVLYPLGVGAGMAAVLVFSLYVAAPEVSDRFASVELLWLICPCLVYWLGRMWIKTARGEMHDDPVVFTLRDGGTRLVVTVIGLLFLMAAFFPP